MNNQNILLEAYNAAIENIGPLKENEIYDEVYVSKMLKHLKEEGYALVPLIPTEAMLQRGTFEMDACLSDPMDECKSGKHIYGGMIDAYQRETKAFMEGE